MNAVQCSSLGSGDLYVKADCPKCGSTSAWYRPEGPDIVLGCLCGYRKVVYSKLETITIEHRDLKEETKLPRRETHLWATVMCLYVMRSASSADITERMADLGMEFTVSDVSSYLTILRTKNLVRTTEFKRGVVGGSTWELTERCIALIGPRLGV